MRQFWIFVIAIIFLTGCNYSIQKNPPLDFPSGSNYAASELTYSSVYARVFRASCISCHGSSGGVNLETYESTKVSLAKIYQIAIIERKMPKSPTSPLTADQLGLLNAWILAGAPELPGPDDLPLGPTFDSLKSHIFEVKCMICHAPGKPAARVPLVTREDFLNSPLDIVVPGKADESGIILAVTGQIPNKFMPPPVDASGQPTGFSKLRDEEIKAIRDWINNGAKD